MVRAEVLDSREQARRSFYFRSSKVPRFAGAFQNIVVAIQIAPLSHSGVDTPPMVGGNDKRLVAHNFAPWAHHGPEQFHAGTTG
jgi:hypothetical protein